MEKVSWGRFLAGMLFAGSLAASAPALAGDSCGTTGSCTSGECCSDVCCQHCEKIFEEAGQKLTDQLAAMSCCDCACESSAACCAPASVCGDGSSDPCGDLVGDACGEGCGASEEGCQGLFGEIGHGITIGGWTQFGYQDRPDGAFTGNGVFNSVNFGPGTNSNSREWGKFNLNQQALYLNKTADGSKGVGFGFRAEMIYGVDGNDAQAFGNVTPGTYDFLNGWNHGIYEWALPQLYAEVASGDVSVKVGHFYTPVGYEVIPSGGNFFLSRQLTFYNSEPFTHSGVLATYTASDTVQILGGWTAGWDTGFKRFNDSSNFLGGTIITLSDKATFTHMLAVGNFGQRGDGAVNSSILSYNWTDKWTSVHQFDVLGTNASTGPFAASFQGASGQADNSTSQINYLFYAVNDKIRLGTRQEWYKADGVSYNTLTYGVNVTPVSNFVVRPEVRHMWAPGARNSAAAPGHNDLFNETVFGVDAILTY